MQDSRAVIDALNLTPHPEGGWYRETWRAPATAGAEPGARSAGTAILYLLEKGGRSHWHRVDADELWLWHAGAPIELMIADESGGDAVTIPLGGNVIVGYRPQALVPATRWQAARAPQGWALVTCVVVPGFDFAGFELAAPGWRPGG